MKEGQTAWLLLLAGLGAIVAPGFYRDQATSSQQPQGQSEKAHRSASLGAPGGQKTVDLSFENTVQSLLANVTWTERNGTLAATVKDARRTNARVSSLIVMLPDPMLTNFDVYFDQVLESVERAAMAASYFPVRYSLPWPRPGSNAREAYDIELPLPAAGNPLVRVRPPQEATGEKTPGVLVFERRRKDPLPDVLIVLLVGETATGGVHQDALEAALAVANTIADGDSIPILGPFFSGSAVSLRIGIDRYLAMPGQRGFSLVSGSANSPSAYATLADSSVSYATTVVPVPRLEQTMLGVVRDRADGSREKERSIALLVEAGTSWGAEAREREDRTGAENGERHPPADNWAPQVFHFPIHIAQLRAARERTKEKASADERLADLNSTLQLRLDTDADSRDDLPARSSLTPYTVELTLREDLAAIAREHYRYLGIEATDPTDAVFIAQEARRYCPGVQLFTLDAQRIFTHPDLMRDLNGMLVVSTYPLSEEIDGWTNPEGGKREGFASEVAEGVYNAGLALLAKMNLFETPANHEAVHPPFRDYRNPFRTDAGGAGAQIWLSMINNGGIWPLQLRKPASDYLVENRFPPAIRKIRHSVGALTGGLYALVVALASLHVYWFFRRWLRRRKTVSWTPFLVLQQARSAGVMLVSVFLTCLYWTAVAFGLSRDPETIWARLGWYLAIGAGGGASVGLLVALGVCVGPTLNWFSTIRLQAGARLNSQLRSLVVTALGAIVGVLGVRFILVIVFPVPDPNDPNLVLTLARTIQPMGGVSPALPLFYIAVGFYLWGLFGYRRALEQARFPDTSPFPHDESAGQVGLRRLAEAVAFDAPSSVFRWEERAAVGGAVVPAMYFWFRITPTFEGAAFDDLFRALVFFLGAAVLSSVGRMLAQWNDLRRLLRRLSCQPLAAAFHRIGPLTHRTFGLGLGAPVPRPAQLEDCVRLATLLGECAPPAMLGPAFRERLATEAELVRRAFVEEADTIGKDEETDARVGTQAALFRMSRLLYVALERAWSSPPGEAAAPQAAAPHAKTDEADPDEVGPEDAFATYRRRASPEWQHWVFAAEDLVARQIGTVINLGLSRVKGLMTFAILGALMLLFAAVCYPFHPVRFVHLFAWWFTLLAILPTCTVVAGIERDHLLSRLAHTTPGRFSFNPAFIGQVVIYGVVPVAAVIATVFPEIGGVLFSWLQPVAGVLK